jgi:nucleotide-binding universal stress UspA family protein
MSEPWRKVLCAVQFDSGTSATLEMARQIAETTGATVIFFHAVPMPIEAIGQPLMVQPLIGAENDARSGLSHIAGEMALMSHEIEVTSGDPAICIIEGATRLAADVIVMATHGRVGLSHFFLGSVAERVVRESPVPVITVRTSSHRDRLLSEAVLIA